MRVKFFIVFLGALIAWALHVHGPQEQEAPREAKEISFFTHTRASPRAEQIRRPTAALSENQTQSFTDAKDSERPTENEVQLAVISEQSNPELFSKEECEAISRRAASIYGINFVGIPYTPQDGTLEHQLLKEVAHSNFPSRDVAREFVFNLCTTTERNSSLPLWPVMVDGALRSPTEIVNATF